MSLTLVGFGFSAYLTYRELFSIHAICEECATSAGFLTVLMCLSVWQFLRGDDDAAAARRYAVRAERSSRVGDAARQRLLS